MSTLEELRAEIDNVDHQILELLGLRAQLVHQVGELKSSEEEIVAIDRQVHVIASRRAWARQHNLDPDFAEALYRAMIDYFIEQEKRQLAMREKKSS
jgi:isochorismate pyruvate lyase